MRLLSSFCGILIVACLLEVDVLDAKGLRMRGGVLGTGRNSLGRRSRKPWGGGVRRQSFGPERGRMRPGMGMGDSDACVGLCYYMKILEAKKKEREEILKDPNKRRKSATTPKPVKIPYAKPYPWERTSTEAPCVGLCFHYRKIGMANPHQEWFDSWSS